MAPFLYAGLLLIITLHPLISPASDGAAGPLIARGDRNFPPYEFVNQQGEPDGFNVDLLKAIAARLNMEVDIGLDAWETVREQLASGTIHLVTGMVRSAERETEFDFSITHAGVFYCLFVRRGSPIKSIEDAGGKAVIVHSRAYSHEWLLKRRITDTIIPAASPQAALQLLAEGRHDCAIIERLSALDLLYKLKIGTVVMAGPPLMCAPYAFAVRKGDDRLLAQLNEGIHLMHQSGEYDDLYRKWFSVADANTRRLTLVRTGALVLAVFLGLWAAALIANAALTRMVRRRTADLRRSEKRFHALCELLPQTVFETDSGGAITFLNRSGMEMLGLDEKAIHEGVQLSEFLHRSAASDRPSEIEHRRVTSCLVSGRGVDAFPALLYTAPGTGGQIREGQRGLLVDITLQKELEKQVIESQKLEALGRLAGGVAHDFSNIVTGISAYAHLIKRQPQKAAAVADSADRILIGCDRATDLVRHFLVTAGRRQPVKQSVRLGQVVTEIFKLLMPTYGRSIELNNTIAVDDDDTVWAEPAQVFQVLMNLCVNGAQAMAGLGGELTVGLLADGGTVQAPSTAPGLRMLFVRDTGPGIADADRNHIFEPFFTTRRQGGGTGIGLFVVSQTLAELGGVIQVKSDPGKGATFVVGLPVADADAAA